MTIVEAAVPTVREASRTNRRSSVPTDSKFA
jgi:hypothetical protein